MTLDLTSLKKAASSLERAVTVAENFIRNRAEREEQEVVRAGVIQNFEFTYKLSWKLIKRWIDINYPGQTTDTLTIKELFRLAGKYQLITDVESWFEYHRARNKSSHIYDEIIAEDVYETAIRFSGEAKALLALLEKRND